MIRRLPTSERYGTIGSVPTTIAEFLSKAIWLAPLIPLGVFAFAVWQYVHPPTVIKRESEIAKMLKEMNVSGYRDVIASLERHVARRYGADGMVSKADRIILTAVISMFGLTFGGGYALLFVDGWKRWSGLVWLVTAFGIYRMYRRALVVRETARTMAANARELHEVYDKIDATRDESKAIAAEIVRMNALADRLIERRRTMLLSTRIDPSAETSLREDERDFHRELTNLSARSKQLKASTDEYLPRVTELKGMADRVRSTVEEKPTPKLPEGDKPTPPKP